MSIADIVNGPRTFRIDAGVAVAHASVEAVVAADGWHRVDATARAGGVAASAPPVEGKPEVPPAPGAPE